MNKSAKILLFLIEVCAIFGCNLRTVPLSKCCLATSPSFSTVGWLQLATLIFGVAFQAKFSLIVDDEYLLAILTCFLRAIIFIICVLIAKYTCN